MIDVLTWNEVGQEVLVKPRGNGSGDSAAPVLVAGDIAPRLGMQPCKLKGDRHSRHSAQQDSTANMNRSPG